MAFMDAHMARKRRSPIDELPPGFEILHEDRDVLVIHKPSGWLTMGTERQQLRTAYFVMSAYVKRGQAKSPHRIFIVHRLDRDTSGVLIFAKTEKAKTTLQEQWQDTEKVYLAVVEGQVQPKSAVLENLLDEKSAVHRVWVTPNKQKGRLAKTEYQVLKQTKARALLKVDLHTGRKHQIRVQLAEAGYPISGDKVYGQPKQQQRFLALHAWSLSFNHPYSGKRMSFAAEPPSYFSKLVGPYRLPEAGEKCEE